MKNANIINALIKKNKDVARYLFSISIEGKVEWTMSSKVIKDLISEIYPRQKKVITSLEKFKELLQKDDINEYSFNLNLQLPEYVKYILKEHQNLSVNDSGIKIKSVRPVIHAIDIPNFDKDMMDLLAYQTESLISVNIQHISEDILVDEILDFLSSLKNLKVLGIGRFSYKILTEGDINKFPGNLTKLKLTVVKNIAGYESFDENILIKILEKNKTLTKLVLDAFDPLTNKGLKAIAENCKELRHLNLLYNNFFEDRFKRSSISAEEILMLAYACKHLSRIEFKDNSYNHELFTYLAGVCANLKSIYVKGCEDKMYYHQAEVMVKKFNPRININIFHEHKMFEYPELSNEPENRGEYVNDASARLNLEIKGDYWQKIIKQRVQMREIVNPIECDF